MHLALTDNNGDTNSDLGDGCVLHSSIAIFSPQSFAHLFVIGNHNIRTINKLDTNVNTL